jgi:hypothetical protein
MSEERVVCSHHLSIRFDQLEGNRVNWYVEPDDEVLRARDLSLIDLAERGAPLSALGIRALLKLCIDGLVFNALEQANSIQSYHENFRGNAFKGPRTHLFAGLLIRNWAGFNLHVISDPAAVIRQPKRPTCAIPL